MNSSKSNDSLASTIKTIAFFVVGGLLLSYILISAFLPTQAINIFRFRPYVVLTESMEPVINAGDIVVVTKADLDELKVDDIITFMADINGDGVKEPVTHYIADVYFNAQDVRIFRTKPIYENVVDNWFLQDQDILGQYWFRIPVLGLIVQFAQSPFGIAAISVNIIVIGSIIYLVKTGKKVKIEPNQEEK